MTPKNNMKEFLMGLPIELRIMLFTWCPNTDSIISKNTYEAFLIANNPGVIEQRPKGWHIHHMLPSFAFEEYIKKNPGCDTVSLYALKECNQNLIILSKEDHIKAHWLRYECYGHVLDKSAYHLLQGQSSEAHRLISRLGGKKIAAIRKEQKTGFWDPKLQTILSLRSLKNPNYKMLRSIAGKMGSKIGKARGGANALPTARRRIICKVNGRTSHLGKYLKETDIITFFYKKIKVDTKSGFLTGGMVADHINTTWIPQLSKDGATHISNRRLSKPLKNALDRAKPNSNIDKVYSTQGWTFEIERENWD